MKFFLISSLIFSGSTFAQSINLSTFKQLLTANQAKLETVHIGMSKKETTLGKVATESGDCNFRTISNQTIIKIQADNIIVLAKKVFQPQNTPACRGAELRAYQESYLFAELKPTVSEMINGLDQTASDILSISKTGNVVDLVMNLEESDEEGNTYRDQINLKYDLNKSLFRATTLSQGSDYKITTEDSSNYSPSVEELTNILFCEDNDGDNSDCVPGNYTDLLP